MKSLKVALMGLLVVVLLSGCGSKTLTCEGEEQGMKVKVVSKFDGRNKFVSADMSMDFKLEEDMLKVISLEDMKKTLDESMKKQFKDSAKVEVKDNGKDTVTINVSFDKKGVKEIAGEEANDTYASMKKELEKQKFTCK